MAVGSSPSFARIGWECSIPLSSAALRSSKSSSARRRKNGASFSSWTSARYPLSEPQIAHLVGATGARDGQPGWTYSDIRTRLYPAALALAFPDEPLLFDHLRTVTAGLKPSPVLEDR